MRKAVTAGVMIMGLTLVGCAGDPPEEPETSETVTETAEPTETATETAEPEGQWAVPEEIDASLDVETDPDLAATVRWSTVGETLHVYVAGSSSEGCVPVPIDAWTDGEQVEIEFEPVEPMQTCTADLVMHGWEVAWDEPIEVNGPMPLFLTNLDEDGEQVEAELPAEPLG